MKWSFVIQQKLKAAILLSGIMILVIVGSLLSRFNVQGIDKSVSSIYQDRLIPATTIIFLTENLYGKRLALEKHLFYPDLESPEKVKMQLNAFDTSIDSLIRIFEKTYLVDQESKSLDVFKFQVKKYSELEDHVISHCKTGSFDEGKKIFAGDGVQVFQGTIANLNELTSIQSDIGKDILKESRVDMASFDLISFLQIGLIVVIGIMILALIQSDRIINKPAQTKKQSFNLN